MVVNSIVYRNGERGEVIDPENISDVINEPDAFVWLGLYQPDPPFMKKMQESSACMNWRSRMH